MKAVLEFNLDDEDDEETYKVYRDAVETRIAIEEFKQQLRRMWKYEEFKTEAEHEIVDKIYDMFHDCMSEHGVKDV